MIIFAVLLPALTMLGAYLLVFAVLQIFWPRAHRERQH